MRHTSMRAATDVAMALFSAIAISLLRSIVLGPVRALVSRWACLLRTFEGPYPDGASVAVASTGYESQRELERVLCANSAVVRGDSAFARDSVLFPATSEPASQISALRACNSPPDGLRILGFNRAFGSFYHQARPFLSGIDDAQVIFLKPNPATTDSSERACVGQHVSRSIYRAPYPTWLLPEDDHLGTSAGSDMVSSWEGLGPPFIVVGIRALLTGATFARRAKRGGIQGKGHV